MGARHIVLFSALVSLCAVAIPLAADIHDSQHAAANNSCPPALRHVSTRCIPQDQARRFYRRGDRIIEDYNWIAQPGHWAPDPYGSYVQAGAYVYQVNRETQTVLRLIGARASLADQSD